MLDIKFEEIFQTVGGKMDNRSEKIRKLRFLGIPWRSSG